MRNKTNLAISQRGEYEKLEIPTIFLQLAGTYCPNMVNSEN